MSWQLQATHPWSSPLDFAARYGAENMTLLHSGMLESGARYSFLLLEPIEIIEASDWDDFPNIPADAPAHLPYYIALLGYGLREHGKPSAPSPIPFANATFLRYKKLWRFDHDAQKIEEFRADGDALKLAPPTALHDEIKVTNLHSNFSRDTYLDAVADTLHEIEAGNFYQANITRKFWGALDHAPDTFALYQKLCALSPAPYSAYIRHGARAVLSSSPECFLRIDAQGEIISRPIKGSAPRDADAVKDAQVARTLQESEKNLAENLMITDLIRHDLAQVSEVGSVRVAAQSALHSYRTIHHLISTITAQKSPIASAYDAVRACFPPGSMTGAPKIAAMRWCAQMEQIERGLYSGAIGWFGGENTCDLSVVIRTLLIDGNRFEFQVGGGIVADSTPENEWQECLGKARAMMALLNLTPEQLAEASPTS